MMVMGLGIVCWLIAATLIGIAASLDARRRWSQMSERARRFVKSERFKSSPPGNTRKLATARSPRWTTPPSLGRFADLFKPSSHAVHIACRHAVIRADSDSARPTPARSITRPCGKVMIDTVTGRPARTKSSLRSRGYRSGTYPL